MRISVVDPDPIDAGLTARTLSAAGYLVSTFRGVREMLRAALVEPPQLIVLELDAGAELVGKVRAHAGQLYILVLTNKPMASVAGAAFAAGADDVMRKPLVRDELLARVAKGIRFQNLIAATRGDDASQDPIGRLRAWKGAELTVCVDLAAMTRAPLDVRDTPIPGWTPQHAARTRLFLPGQACELTLLVTADHASLDATVRQVFGAPDPDLGREALLEMANLAAGAIKRKALAENVVFTLDLPASVEPGAGFALAEAQLAKHWFLVDRERCFELRAAIRQRANHVVSIGELREGMVLVGGVRNVTGMLLAAAGTRLTAAMIERLRAQLPGAFSIEVNHAAA